VKKIIKIIDIIILFKIRFLRMACMYMRPLWIGDEILDDFENLMMNRSDSSSGGLSSKDQFN
jgi:hypothetical protein